MGPTKQPLYRIGSEPRTPLLLLYQRYSGTFDGHYPTRDTVWTWLDNETEYCQWTIIASPKLFSFGTWISIIALVGHPKLNYFLHPWLLFIYIQLLLYNVEEFEKKLFCNFEYDWVLKLNQQPKFGLYKTLNKIIDRK